MQAAPWIGTTDFTQSDLLSSAQAYRGHGVSVYLLWGVEDWLDPPAWMQTGITAINVLREGVSPLVTTSHPGFSEASGLPAMIHDIVSVGVARALVPTLAVLALATA